MSSLVYNPGQKKKDDLLSEFVVRQDIYDEIMRDLESSDMNYPEQHYLLVGQRGMGKTTLLLRLQYGIEDSIILGGRVLPIAFTEEQYQINELAGLWEYVAEYLEDHYEFDDLYDEISKHSFAPDLEEKAYELLDKELEKTGKHLVLLIDNIGDLFHKLEKNEIRRLREILQTSSRIRVIGGSSNYYLDAVLDYHQPFYEFFKIVRLEGLDKDEAEQVILKLGEINGEKEKIERIVRETPGRIETLRILTGGVPRTIAIMFGIFLDYEHEHALKDLEKILDAVTPLYKHRMDDLPVQQQKIVDAVARHWEPITVKELAAKTRLISKTLSAQLNHLEKEQIVVKQDTANRNKTYMIRERFWNIWYLMRYGRRDDKEKIIWLVRFLESWFSDEELKERIDLFVEKVRRAEVSEDQLMFFGKAYAALKNLSPSSKLRLKSIEQETREEILMSEDEWLRCAREEYDRKNYYDCLRYLMKIRNLNNPGKSDLFVQIGINITAIEATIKQLPDQILDIEVASVYWALLNIGILVQNTTIILKLDINHESQLSFLQQFLTGHIIISEYYKATAGEMYFSIAMAARLIKHLIQVGLYNSVFKILEETHTVGKTGTTIYIKDQWKPLYIAVKYLNQPEELQKQPSEVRTAAFSLVATITEQREIVSEQ